jgi:cytochrome P450
VLQQSPLEPAVRSGASTRAVTRLDDLAFNLLHVIPAALQGTFIRRPFWVRVFSRLHPDPSAVRFIGTLRRKHDSDYLYVSLLGKKSLLVLDVDGIRHVLDHSPHVYADPRAKHLGMGHFQPDALTISRGEEWQERRRFNEEVLAYRQALHPMAGAFLALARDEARSLDRPRSQTIGWSDFARIFERVALGVIFGPDARSTATTLSARLTRMMHEANRIFGLKESRDFRPFYDEVRGRLAAPPEATLVTGFAAASPTVQTAPESQIPHWMFATRDTLPANVLNTLALIVSHPDVEQRVRAELEGADTSTPAGIAELTYLQACLDETMRLWPTTMMLVREALADDTLNGERIPAGIQVIIHNGFNHRNPDTVAEPDRFLPERWAHGQHDYRFNFMSNGPQSCVGRRLALFLGKSVLGEALKNATFRLESPNIRPDRPIPYGIDTYRVRLVRKPLSRR